MPDRTLTAMYDSAGAAEAARDTLISAIPGASATVHGATSGSAETGGFWEDLKNLFVPDDDRAVYGEGLRRGNYLLSARVPEGMEDQALDILERTDAIDVDERSASWRAEGWSADTMAGGTAATGAGYGTATQAGMGTERTGAGFASGARRGEDDETIEVVEEDLRVGKREVGRGGVRVRSYVVERPVEEQVELRQEHVTVERRPVDREITAGEAAFQERTIEAVERGEEAVVSKSARVTEEIDVRKDVERDVETVRDTVRKTEVEVEDDRAATGVTRDPTIGTR